MLDERSRLTGFHQGGTDIFDLYDPEPDGLYVKEVAPGEVLITGYTDGGDSWVGATVPIQAVIHALLPDDVRSYLSDLIDINDGGEEVEWGHPEDVRARAIALLFKSKEA